LKKRYWSDIGTRTLGGLQMVGGLAEIIGSGIGEVFSGGTATIPMVLIGLNGGDNIIAGYNTLTTGQQTDTLLHQGVAAGATALGASPGVANGIATATEIATGVGLGVAAVTSEVKAVQGAGNVVVSSWNEAVTAVDNLIQPKTSQLNNLLPDAKIGYRGSLSTGTKYSTGGPFDPTDWDVDAFIVSDNLASQIGGSGFRNGRDISSIEQISNELETLFKNISGYRTAPGKEFTFRVWTQAEYDQIIKNTIHKIF
jgi:filamentous hemagglutinin